LDAAAADGLLRRGVAAMQRGAPSEARALFERVGREAAGPAPWLLIAQACQAQGDQPACDAALDRLLAEQPRSIRGLIMKGDGRARVGDDRAATSFYQVALEAAGHSQSTGTLPETLIPDLQRVQAYLAKVSGRYEAHLQQALVQAGITPDAAGPRFRQSLDILAGRSEVYLQQPTSFYFPGLPQRFFFERDEFAWSAALEGAAPAIRAELDAVLTNGGSGFAPYITPDPNRPQSTFALAGDPSWSALYLWRAGAREPEAATRFPATMAALEQVPLAAIDGRAPTVLFSLLRPGTHIPAHHGFLNTRLICHLPLVVPGDCRLRVGSESREWRFGETLIFDDSMEHEAWNDSAETRVILLFEIWRPELSAEERRALTALYQAVNLYGADL
jgi:aspartyl/asparaginyl beta-hydroxylase (cupin superfamily)